MKYYSNNNSFSDVVKIKEMIIATEIDTLKRNILTILTEIQAGTEKCF